MATADTSPPESTDPVVVIGVVVGALLLAGVLVLVLVLHNRNQKQRATDNAAGALTAGELVVNATFSNFSVQPQASNGFDEASYAVVSGALAEAETTDRGGAFANETYASVPVRGHAVRNETYQEVGAASDSELSDMEV